MLLISYFLKLKIYTYFNFFDADKYIDQFSTLIQNKESQL